MRQLSILLLATFVLTFTSCGPSKSELRVELQVIEGELFQLQIAADQIQMRMNQAQFQSLGSLANSLGGVVDGDDWQALGGLGNALHAGATYNQLEQTMGEVRARYNKLAKRRGEILKKL